MHCCGVYGVPFSVLDPRIFRGALEPSWFGMDIMGQRIPALRSNFVTWIDDHATDLSFWIVAPPAQFDTMLQPAVVI